MLSLFPELLTFGILAPVILRVTVGVFFFLLGHKHLTKERTVLTQSFTKKLKTFTPTFALIVAGVEMVIGLFLIAGFLTQGVALLGIILILKWLWFKKDNPALAPHHPSFYYLLIAVLLSLLLTGAGVPAVDLPL